MASERNSQESGSFAKRQGGSEGSFRAPLGAVAEEETLLDLGVGAPEWMDDYFWAVGAPMGIIGNDGKHAAGRDLRDLDISNEIGHKGLLPLFDLDEDGALVGATVGCGNAVGNRVGLIHGPAG